MQNAVLPSETGTTYGAGGADGWLKIAGFVLIVWVMLMFLPLDTTQLFLLAVLVAMLYSYFAA